MARLLLGIVVGIPTWALLAVLFYFDFGRPGLLVAGTIVGAISIWSFVRWVNWATTRASILRPRVQTDRLNRPDRHSVVIGI